MSAIGRVLEIGKAAGGVVMDGLENVLTGMGIAGRDSSLTAFYRWRRLTYRQVEQFHDASYIAQIVCDKVPARATKKWLTHVVPEKQGGSDMVAKLVDEDDRLDAKAKFRKAISWARLYGGAMMLLVVDDGKDLKEPLELESINKLQNLVILHRWELYR